MKRVIVFIDNSNVFKRLESLNKADGKSWCKKYDPKYLAEKLAGNRDLLKTLFYCAPPPQALQKRSPKIYATQNSYYEKIKKQEKVELKYARLVVHDGKLYEKNLDTKLTADVLKMASANAYDHAIIVANDGDYIDAVEGAKELGKKVEVAHFKKSYSMDLKQSADITRRLRPTFFKHIDDDGEQTTMELEK